MRSWARDLGRRLAEAPRGLSRNEDLRALGETVGGLAHNFNNSLAAILAYTELMLRESEPEAAQRRLMVIRDVALEASATVRQLQEFVSRQPQAAFGPVGLPAVIAEALEMTAPRWRDEARARAASSSRSPRTWRPCRPSRAMPSSCATPSCASSSTRSTPCRGAAPSASGPPARSRAGWCVEVTDTGVGMSVEQRRRLAEHGAEPPARPGARAGPRRGLRHRRAPRGQRERSTARVGKGTTVRLRLHASRFQIIPRLGGDGRAPGRARARRARAPGGRRPAPRSPCCRTCCARGARHHDRRQRRRGASRPSIPGAHDVVITDLGMPKIEWLGGGRAHQDPVARRPRVFLLTGWGEGVSAHESSKYVDHVHRQARVRRSAAGAARRARRGPRPVRVTPRRLPRRPPARRLRAPGARRARHARSRST